jgi:hypothetical protein
MLMVLLCSGDVWKMARPPAGHDAQFGRRCKRSRHPEGPRRTGGAGGASTSEDQAAAMDREVLPDIDRACGLDPANAEACFARGRLRRATCRPGGQVAFGRLVPPPPLHPGLEAL